MACRYFKIDLYKEQGLIGGSHFPTQINDPCCKLSRCKKQADLAKCKSIPSHGPCWWWTENERGPDTEFLHGPHKRYR